jgi:plasmid stabilization system protein ParE
MSFSVVFMPEADREMDDIEDYLSQFYASTARSFFTELKRQATSLETMPYMYPEYDADPYFRRMVIDDYLLFYSVDKKRNLVVVHRIFHSKRDISRQIMEHRTLE